MSTRAFRATLQAANLILSDDQITDANRDRERWRFRHLHAMILLAERADPSLVIDNSLTLESLYDALSAAVPLAHSAVFSIHELLQYLAVVEGRDLKPPAPFDPPPPAPLVSPWDAADKKPGELTGAELDDYADMLYAAMQAAAADMPWRDGAERDRFQPDHLVGEPMDIFKSGEPGVMPPEVGKPLPE
jgi:hypothetical protein